MLLSSKKFEKKIIIVTLIALICSLILTIFPNMFFFIAREDVTSEYPVKLFGKNIITINIDIDSNKWDGMIENKMLKEYVPCNLTIDGTEFKEVGIRPKGNSSLTSVQGERLSFRFDFDHYVNNQTCYGLTQMVINNLQADATYMKDYIAYDLMEYMGVEGPLHTYAYITLNNEPFGVYLLAEVYEKDYLERTHKDISTRLYNVKSSGFDRFVDAVVDSETCEVISYNGIKEANDMSAPLGLPPGDNGMNPMPPQGEQMPQDSTGMPSRMGQENDMGNNPPAPPGGMNGGGGDLVYIDESTTSYQYIFANSVFDDTDAEDYARVIRAIKYLNKENVSTNELEKHWDIDEILRYFAVHTFMVNGDSYYGNMKQNYYLAEQNGKISVLPWDYNLSFGTFGGGPGGSGGPGGPVGPGKEMSNINSDGYRADTQAIDSTTEVINHAIDTPTIEVELEDRPLLSVLLNNDEYKEKYHRYLNELAEYASGDFIDKLNIVNGDISPYIQKEKIRFFSYEEHEKAFSVLNDFLKLRSQSVIEQINGVIPSTTEEQNQNVDELIVADFSIDEMGSMGGPGGGPGGPPPMGGGMDGQDVNAPPQNGDENQMGMMPPPPPGMRGEGGMMPPPPGMSGMMQGQSSNNGIVILIALLVLFIVFIGVKLFKRNY